MLGFIVEILRNLVLYMQLKEAIALINSYFEFIETKFAEHMSATNAATELRNKLNPPG